MKRKLQFSTAQTIGSRPTQEDNFFCKRLSLGRQKQPAILSIIADGMGGHVGGHIASRIVVEAFQENINKHANTNPTNLLIDSLNVANQRVHKHLQVNPQNMGMGTTLLASLVTHETLYYLSVGDSQLYLFRNGKICLINQLHSLAKVSSQEAINNGSPIIDTSQAFSHILTSCITGQKIKQFDHNEQALQVYPDDVILLASDGINSLNGAELCQYLSTDTDITTQDALAESLLTGVIKKQQPNQDNTTIIVIQQ